jgi:hypothetical protein
MMARRLLATLTCSLALLAAAADSKRGQPKAATTYTGCVDQRGSAYYLVESSEMAPVARLTATGASEDDWFAKHVGHQVRVTGAPEAAGADKGDSERRIRVTRIESVSDTCPAPSGPGK